MLALIGFGVFGALTWVVLGRRPGALDRWMAEMRATGEKFTLAELGLDRPARTNAAMEVIETAASRFKALERAKVSVRFQSAEDIGSERKRVAWAEANLHNSIMGGVLDWDALGRELLELRPVLASIQEAMRDPPLDSGRDYTGTFRVVNFIAIREAAAALHNISMYDLHRGDLSLAHQDLLALVGMAHLHAQSWTLVDQMIRSAIANLATDAVWNALQSPGWNDRQLSELQDLLASLSFFKELGQSYRTERAFGLRWYTEMKTNRNSRNAGPGIINAPRRLADLPDAARGLLWKSFWADGDFLTYCRYHQARIDSMHTLAGTRSYRQIAPQLAEARKRLDRTLSGIGKYRYPWTANATGYIGKEVDRLVQNETSRQLAITAIALRRFALRHGRLPGDLHELQPDFLRELPIDFYDGQPVRYRLDADGSFTLYSVGVDFQDNGGAPGKDWSWPKPTWPLPDLK